MTKAFRRRLLGWFRRTKRDLPWRRTRHPYRIWLAEVMLQQTRVAAAVPYYERFLRRFPSVRALARAPSEDVLKRWAGLGYYTRARNLHRAAQEIVAGHNGQFPRKREAALALPGVGRYTAAAVLSIAYGAPLAVLDGNVARVLARLGGVRGDVRAPRRWRELERRAQELMPAIARGRGEQRSYNPPGEWNQAMMELGATVCTPLAPRCAECPVARWCQARKLGIQEEVPAARRKRAPVRIRIAAAVLFGPRGRTLLVRQNDGLFSGMWQFPAVEVAVDARDELLAHLRNLRARARGKKSNAETPRAQRSAEKADKDLSQSAQRTPRAAEENMIALEPARHNVTFREIRLLPFLLRVERLPKLAGARVVRLAQLDGLAVSSATRKIAAAAMRATGVGAGL